MLKAESSLPLLLKLLELVLLVEGRRLQLFAPEGNVAHAGRPHESFGVGVVHHDLVEGSGPEGPDLVLVAPVVDGRLVIGGGVGVEGLTLNINVSDCFIVVVQRDGWGNTHHVFRLGRERLLSLEVVDFVHNNIVHVFVLCRVVYDVLIEPSER